MGSRLSYVVFNVTSGRCEQDSQFPIDINAFLGSSSQNILLSSTGDVSLCIEFAFDYYVQMNHSYLNFIS